MKTINDIGEYITNNGYSGLTDDEIESWISFKCDCAKRSADVENQKQLYDQILQNNAAETKKRTAAAIETLNNLINTPLNLKRIGDDN